MKWRITEPHYLTVEFKSPNDGSAVKYEVLLEGDPERPIEIGDGCKYNYKGPPTPNMEPLDKEAEKAKEAYAKHWETTDPINSLPTHMGVALGSPVVSSQPPTTVR